MFDIITFGSATIDIFAFLKPFKKSGEFCFQQGAKEGLKSILIETGGGGTNTAVSFANFGLKTAFCGTIGRDLFADYIQKDLLKRKVNLSLLKRNSQIKTDTSLILSPQIGERAILSSFEESALKIKDIPLNKLKAKWFYMAPLHNKATALLVPVLSLALKEGIKTAVNPSLEQIQKITKTTLKRIDCLIVNEEEFSLLKEKIRKFQGILVVTQGKTGCYVLFQGKKYEAKTRKIKAKERTGAGDSFASGFIAGLFLKNDIQYGINLGLYNSEMCIQKIGAKNGLLKKQDLLKIPAYKIKIC